MLPRPIIESFFNLTGSFARADFVRSKIFAEVNDLTGRVDKWKKATKTPADKLELESSVRESQEMLVMFQKRYGTPPPRGWTSFQVAELSDKTSHYVSSYFAYSLWTHSNFISLFQQVEDAAYSTMVVLSHLCNMTTAELLHNATISDSDQLLIRWAAVMRLLLELSRQLNAQPRAISP